MKNRNHKNYCPVLFSMAAVMFALLAAPFSVAQDENEETYSIDLVQTAEVTKETVELGNKKILTETYTAKEGDHIWQILRNRDLLKQNKLGGILSALKKLNPSLSNIDMIHPGEKIIIPLVITPIPNGEAPYNPEDLETVSLSDLKNLEYYTVSQGDSLIKVINKKYSIPGDELYNQYLGQLRKLNPELKDLNHILPGQKVRLPIYSPKVVRGVIEEKPDKLEKPDKSKQKTDAMRVEAKEIGSHLSKIFPLIGEEWIQQGKYVIPLKPEGQIELIAETFPVINLRNGDKIIVDLYNSLRDDVSEIIKSNWDNYYIVHITEKDNLKSSVSKILLDCNYNKVYKEDESLVFEDNIKIEIKADWIIKLLPEASGNKENIICLNIIDGNSGTVPSSIKNFLVSHGVKIIDYPPESRNIKDIPAASRVVSLDENKEGVIEKLLELAGQDYSSREDIHIYKGEDSNFSLTIKADYFFKRNGKNCIIDLNGLGTDIVPLLKGQKYLVLSLPGKHAASEVISKTLDFLGIAFNNKKHTFFAIPGNKKENVKIMLPGTLFKDSKGQSDFITSINLPPDISSFLSTKVDNIFYIKPSPKAK